MPPNKSSLRANFIQRFSSKFFLMKNVCDFYKYWKQLLVKNKFKKKKGSKGSSYQLQLKAYYILLYSKLR